MPMRWRTKKSYKERYHGQSESSPPQHDPAKKNQVIPFSCTCTLYLWNLDWRKRLQNSPRSMWWYSKFGRTYTIAFRGKTNCVNIEHQRRNQSSLCVPWPTWDSRDCSHSLCSRPVLHDSNGDCTDFESLTWCGGDKIDGYVWSFHCSCLKSMILAKKVLNQSSALLRWWPYQQDRGCIRFLYDLGSYTLPLS